MKYKVNLASCGNLDYMQDPDQSVFGWTPNHLKEVNTLQEAKEACMQFINQEPIGTLGSSQWMGGEIYDSTGKQIGRVSYNGRIWDMNGQEILE